MTPEAGRGARAPARPRDHLAARTFGLLGRRSIRFRITGGLTVRGVIAALQANGANISAQPSYEFALAQDVAQAPAPADTNRKGDSAQYIVDKLGLTEAHAIATGKDVKVAVINSEIDAKHPDLAGRDHRHLRRAALRRPDRRIRTAPAWRARSPRTSACSASRRARSCSRSAPSASTAAARRAPA